MRVGPEIALKLKLRRQLTQSSISCGYGVGKKWLINTTEGTIGSILVASWMTNMGC